MINQHFQPPLLRTRPSPNLCFVRQLNPSMMPLHLLAPDTKLLDTLLQKTSLQILLFSLPITLITFWVYRLYFSPLSHLPGPRITALTPYYLALLTYLNLRTLTLHEWHKRYGPTVRISPTEVSVISPQGVKAVYSDPAYTKYTQLYNNFQHFGEQNSFSSGPKEEHGWRRKAISDRYTMSYVLKEEERSGKILRIVLDYLGFVQESSQKDTGSLVKDARRYCKVDIYTANSFFAADAITSHLFGPRLSTRSLAGNEGDREMINGHYRNARKSQIHLRTQFPTLMAFISGMVSWCSVLVRTARTYMHLPQQSEREKAYAGGSRIDNYGWHAYQQVKSNGRYDGYVAEKLATLVKNSTEAGVQDWTDEGAASELMVR